MSKRDTYRDEPDWDNVSKAYDAQRAAAIQAGQMRELMMPERGITLDECRWGKAGG